MRIATPCFGRTAIAGSLTLAAGVSSVALADTITVCLDGTCDFTDPAAAAAVAGEGDVIEIAAGSYLLDAPVAVYGPSVTIVGAVDGKGRPATILDGQGTTVTLGVLLLPDSTFRIENVVITGGLGEYGGGMSLRDGTNIFENCRITGNHANVHGGGMFLNGNADVTFIGCEISGNTAAHPVWEDLGDGGAGYVSDGIVTLVDTDVSGNWAQNAGGGFAVGPVVLDGSRICGNDAGLHSAQGYGQVTIITGCISESCDCVPTSPADLNQDGLVNGADLGVMIAQWGACAGCISDLNDDGLVNGADLGLLFAAWG